MSYAERIREAIALAGSNRNALARALDISIQAVNQILKGDSKAFSAANSARAARFLQVDSFWLATGEGKPRSGAVHSLAAQELAELYDACENEADRDKALAIARLVLTGQMPKAPAPATEFSTPAEPPAPAPGLPPPVPSREQMIRS